MTVIGIDTAAMRGLANILLCCSAVALAGCGEDAVRPTSSERPVRPAPVVVVRPASGLPQQAQRPQQPVLQLPAQDGPPQVSEIPPDLLAVPDAVPQFEPMSSSGNPDSYEVFGDRYVVLKNPHGYKERGVASWYGTKFHGKRTSSGEPYDMFKMTAAHKTLPIPCYARVTNLDNGRSVVVRINDRGPFHEGRIIDLSYTAAMKLGSLDHGSIPVEVAALDPGTPLRTTQLAGAAPVPVLRQSAPAMAAAVPAPQVVVPVAASAEQQLSLAASPLARDAPTVVMPVPSTADPAQADAPAAHYLQAGLFNDPINAVTLREQLNGIGISNVRLRSDVRNGNRVSRVLIGPFPSVDALAAVRRHLSEMQMSSVPVFE